MITNQWYLYQRIAGFDPNTAEEWLPEYAVRSESTGFLAFLKYDVDAHLVCDGLNSIADKLDGLAVADFIIYRWDGHRCRWVGYT